MSSHPQWQCHCLRQYKNNTNKRRNVRTTQHWGAFLHPLLQWKSSKCYISGMCLRSPRYPACNAHKTCHLWPTLPYIFSYFLKKAWFSNKVVGHKMSFSIFSTTFVWNIFHSRKNCTRYEQNVHRSSGTVPLFLSGFIETWIFEKYCSTKFPTIRLVGTGSFRADWGTDGYTDGQTWWSK